MFSLSKLSWIIISIFKKTLLSEKPESDSQNQDMQTSQLQPASLNLCSKDSSMSDEEKAAGTGSGISTPTKCKARRFESNPTVQMEKLRII